MSDMVDRARILADLPAVESEPPSARNGYGGDPGHRESEEILERLVVARAASTIEAAPVRWAWADRVPLAAVTLIAGREGAGKGVFAADMIARWTRGQLAGDLKGAPINVAIMSIEDDPERVLIPRLTAAGADLDRVFILSATLGADEDQLVLPGDVTQLRTRLEEKEVRVLTVDVPVSFMASNFDSHKDHDIRRAVAGPLTIVASALNLAVVLIVHLNRATSTVILDRIAGSLGMSRASRSVLAVVENLEAEDERLMVLVKSNLGRLEVPALRFKIEGVDVPTSKGPASAGHVVHLGDAPSITARNALQVTDSEESGARDEAAEWLADLLADGPVAAQTVEAERKKAGIAPATLRRAKKMLGIRSEKERGAAGEWKWALGPSGREGGQKTKVLNDDHVDFVDHLDHLDAPIGVVQGELE